MYVFTLVISYSSSLFHSSSLSFHHPPTSLLILHPSIERSDLLSLLEKKSVVTDIASLSRRRRGDGLIQKPARETEMDLFKIQQERERGLIQKPARETELELFKNQQVTHLGLSEDRAMSVSAPLKRVVRAEMDREGQTTREATRRTQQRLGGRHTRRRDVLVDTHRLKDVVLVYAYLVEGLLRRRKRRRNEREDEEVLEWACS